MVGIGPISGMELNLMLRRWGVREDNNERESADNNVAELGAVGRDVITKTKVVSAVLIENKK